ncbi:hypothetical protein DFR30_0455 [Thiogranum longum]|uniref:Carboxypeptidase family protein n=1 Tax=Thiogranum longum TaxID=1537524 RepID=A0A4R1H687_9GAMM|nr:hypothetical protein [Thiogranum longum]TCK17234.1 hypothetical protein DFR30_0455 [Thiogranum longum]
MNIIEKSGILAGLAGLLVMPAWSVVYASNWLEVRVVDKQTGAPVAETSVCLGTSARTDQFGAHRATSDGIVRFDDLPESSMMLTASRRGYQGRQQGLEPMAGNRVVVLNLAPGGGGPVCAAATSADVQPQAAGELEITAVRVSPDSALSSGAQVAVTVSVSGKADQVRIAETADFAGAKWMDLKPKNRFTLSKGKGVKRLYVQVRRLVEVKGATIESLSPVKVVPYRRY